MIRTDTVVGAIGGMATGYVLWLVAILIGDDVTTVSRWSLIVLILSAALAIPAGLWGRWLRGKGNHLWSTFVLALPILPVVLTLAVMADLYV